MPPTPDTSGQVALVIAVLSGGWGLLLTIVGYLIARQVKAIEESVKASAEEARTAWNDANDAKRKLDYLYTEFQRLRDSVATREVVESLKESFGEVKREVRDTGRKLESLRIDVRAPPRRFTPGSDPPPKRGG